MEYISTKDLAKKWNVSPKRIVYMAKNGQIKGAMLIGNSWAFPDNIEKPADGRYKKENVAPVFHFPNFFYRRIDRLEMNTEELEFYTYEIEFHKMNIETAVKSFKKMYDATDSHTIKVGCLYYLCYGYGILKEYNMAIEYYNKFTYLMSLDIPYKKELIFLYDEVACFIEYNSKSEFNPLDYLDLDKNLYPLIAIGYSYRNMVRSLNDIKSVDIESMEILSLLFNKDISPLGFVFIHINLALINILASNQARASFHIQETFSFAFKNEIYYPLVMYFNYFIRYMPLFSQYANKEVLDNLMKWNRDYCEALNELAHLKKESTSPFLTVSDYDYLGYLYRGISSKEVAKIKGLSEQTICEKYKELRIKFNAKSKKDLLDKYKSYLLNRE